MKENELIDHLNTLRAQNIALTLALRAVLSAFPADAKATLKTQYELQCAEFQGSVSLGTTGLDTLQIQRDQFAKTGNRVFGT